MKNPYSKKIKVLLIVVIPVLIALSCGKYNTLTPKKSNEAKTLDEMMKMSADRHLAVNANSGVEKTITIDFHWTQDPYSSSGCANSIFGSIAQTVSAIQIFGTHSKIEAIRTQDGWSNAILEAKYNSASGGKAGEGIAINYPFKKGVTYKILVTAGGTKTHPPALNAQLTNRIPSSNCLDLQPAIYFDQMGLPWAQFPAFLPYDANYHPVYATRQIEFSPDGCYNYLWLATTPQLIDDQKHELDIATVKIIQVSHLEVTGDANFCSSNTKTFQATYDGNLLAEPFTWSVTGDLVIIGSNVGNTIQVQSTTTHGQGVISYTAGDNCVSLVSRSVVIGAPSPEILSQSLDNTLGKIKVAVHAVPNATSYRWYLNNVLISGENSPSITIAIKRNQCNVSYDVKVEAITSDCGLSLKTGTRLDVPPCN